MFYRVGVEGTACTSRVPVDGCYEQRICMQNDVTGIGRYVYKYNVWSEEHIQYPYRI